MGFEAARSVDITFENGETRTVLINTSAKCEAESAVRDENGNPTAFYKLINMEGVTPLRALLWAGIRGQLAAEGRKADVAAFTLEQAGELIEYIDQNELAAMLFLAVVAADRRTTEEQLKNAREAALARVTAIREITATTTEAPASQNSEGLPSDPEA